MAAGRIRILAKAHEDHPFHPVFATANQGQPEPAGFPRRGERRTSACA